MERAGGNGPLLGPVMDAGHALEVMCACVRGRHAEDSTDAYMFVRGWERNLLTRFRIECLSPIPHGSVHNATITKPPAQVEPEFAWLAAQQAVCL